MALHRGVGGDMSLAIDEAVEVLFVEAYLPFASLYSEECGVVGEGAYRVVLDPIDGSDNLTASFPYYGVSMALQYDQETIAAMVVNYVDGSYFLRQKGGVLLRGNLHHDRLEGVFPNPWAKVGLFEKASLHTDVIGKLIKSALKFRSPGAVALSLAYAYDVRYVLFIGQKRPFDVDAGLFLVDALPRYEDENTIIVAQTQECVDRIKSIVFEDR